MITVNKEKLYTIQEAAEIANLTPDALKYRANKTPELLQKMDGRNYIKAADLKQIIEGKKK